ncbi:hypothetical protein B296_00021995 [Ensete ventricosum]|uniref:Uncharacterized protein n=1 Tax=Ensete ventricosum TaxID=4639 RepID=A0A427AK39_ENSVE|nr:hypothetical protein B296_00021995 [Ensete ventricosum]
MAWYPRLLLLLLLLLCHVFSTPVAVSGRKVSMSLYYEALCPFCSSFIVNHLPKIFSNGLISIVDLDLVPFGNARLDPNGSISCQVLLSPPLAYNNILDSFTVLSTQSKMANTQTGKLVSNRLALVQNLSLIATTVDMGLRSVCIMFLISDYENFQHYICKAYDGVPPRACEGLLLRTSKKEKPNEGEPFCHIDGAISSSAAGKKHNMELHY